MVVFLSFDPLNYEDMENISKISEANIASIFMEELSSASESSCTFVHKLCTFKNSFNLLIQSATMATFTH